MSTLFKVKVEGIYHRKATSAKKCCSNFKTLQSWSIMLQLKDNISILNLEILNFYVHNLFEKKKNSGSSFCLWKKILKINLMYF